MRAIAAGAGVDALSPQALTTALRGRVYRRMDGPERLQFNDTSVKIMELGEGSVSATLQALAGRKLGWTQVVPEYDSDNGFGGAGKFGGKLNRKGYLSPNYGLLVVIEELPGSAPDPVRVFGILPAGAALQREPVQQVVGTTWLLDGPTKERVRFETSTQLIWLGAGDRGAGSSAWRALKGENDLVIANWQGGLRRSVWAKVSLPWN